MELCLDGKFKKATEITRIAAGFDTLTLHFGECGTYAQWITKFIPTYISLENFNLDCSQVCTCTTDKDAASNGQIKIKFNTNFENNTIQYTNTMPNLIIIYASETIA